MISEDRHPSEVEKGMEFPLRDDWKMSSVFDQSDWEENEWRTEIKLRTGQAGDDEYAEKYDKLNRTGKKFEERKIERGFDIVNTWKMKRTYCNDD